MNIYQRINKVRTEVEYIKKDAAVQGYKAVSHDLVTSKLRKSLITHGILIIPNQVKGVSIEGETKSGSKKIRYEAEYIISFINIEDPADKFEIQLQAHADDNADKAPGKAVSYAVKYAMLKVFSLETGDNEESRAEIEEQNSFISKDDVTKIEELVSSKNNPAVMPRLLKHFRIADINNLQNYRLKECLTLLEKTPIKESANAHH